jgi:hypothetical protein
VTNPLWQTDRTGGSKDAMPAATAGKPKIRKHGLHSSFERNAWFAEGGEAIWMLCDIIVNDNTSTYNSDVAAKALIVKHTSEQSKWKGWKEPVQEQLEVLHQLCLKRPKRLTEEDVLNCIKCICQAFPLWINCKRHDQVRFYARTIPTTICYPRSYVHIIILLCMPSSVISPAL